MVTMAPDEDLVTLINVFSCEPQNQQRLLDSWIHTTEERLGKLPGIVSAALHRSKDGTRVANYAQWKNAENWENLLRVGSESWFREMGKYAKPGRPSLRSLPPLGQDEQGSGEVSCG